MHCVSRIASILRVFHSNYPYNHQSPTINIVCKMNFLFKKVNPNNLSKKKLHPYLPFSNPSQFSNSKKRKKRNVHLSLKDGALHPSNAPLCVIEASIDIHTSR